MKPTPGDLRIWQAHLSLSRNIPCEAVKAEQAEELEAVDGLVQIVEAGGVGCSQGRRSTVGDGNVSYFF